MFQYIQEDMLTHN